MMGPKKLSEIKEELRRAFAKEGQDAVASLEADMASRKRPPKGFDVLAGLRDFLKEPQAENGGRRSRRPANVLHASDNVAKELEDLVKRLRKNLAAEKKRKPRRTKARA